MRRLFLLLVVAGAISGCGLFSPNEPEMPVEQTPGVIDPFNFGDIIANTRNHFSDLQYTELFYDSDSLYISSNNRRFDKDQFLDHLNTVAATNDKSWFESLIIQWEPDSTMDSVVFQLRDPVTINPTYRVWLPVKDPRQADPKKITYVPQDAGREDPDYTVRSTFLLLFNQNRWRILTFKDGYSEKSIFHPEFSLVVE